MSWVGGVRLIKTAAHKQLHMITQKLVQMIMFHCSPQHTYTQSVSLLLVTLFRVLVVIVWNLVGLGVHILLFVAAGSEALIKIAEGRPL